MFYLRLSPDGGPPRVTLSPKILFQEDTKSKTLTAEEYFASPKGTKSLNNSEYTDYSTLAITLHDSVNSDIHPMDTDELKLDDSDNLTYMMSDDEDIITSTPIIKSKINKKVLTFD